MLSKKQFIFVILFCIVLLGAVFVLMFKIQDFMVAYERCIDDFAMIEKCGCLPREGDYSYFKRGMMK